jgi:hypothetical protein
MNLLVHALDLDVNLRRKRIVVKNTSLENAAKVVQKRNKFLKIEIPS